MGAHQLLVYADDVNLLGDDIDTIKKHTETLIDTNEEVDTEKTKDILLSCHQNTRKNDIKIANRCFQNVTHFIYLGMAVLNLIMEEVKRGLTSGNAFYNSVQNFLSSCLLSKNTKIRTYETIILPMVLKCICKQRMNYKSIKTTLYVIIRCPSYYDLQVAASDGGSQQYKKK
jgi:hypothetical protein